MTPPKGRMYRLLLATAAASSVAQLSAQDLTVTDDIANEALLSSANCNAAISAAWSGARDVGSHLYRHRAGIRPGSRAAKPVKAPEGAAHSAKGAKVSAVEVPVPNRWEVFGSLFFYTEENDNGFNRRIKKKNDKKNGYGEGYGGSFLVGGSESSLDVYGGSVGIEYRINRNWNAGIGISGSQGDLDAGAAGSADIDSISVVPYVSYYQQDAVGDADFWAGLMYSYGMHSYDIRRNTGAGLATASPDANTHLIEMNVGLTYGDEDFVHGPYAGLRYITGTIDAYTELGPLGVYTAEQDIDSLVSILGYQASWRMRSGSGYWVPQLRAAWEHEFEDDKGASGVPSYARDEDIAVLGAGIGYWWDNGWHVGLDYEGRFGSETTGHYGSLNVGKEF